MICLREAGQSALRLLSRGADFCVFVEQQRKAADCIRENLNFTRLAGQAHVFVQDAAAAVKKMDGESPFQMYFYGPALR